MRSVVSRQPAAYDDADSEVLSAFATQASIAIRNARLIEELARSRAVIERRAALLQHRSHCRLAFRRTHRGAHVMTGGQQLRDAMPGNEAGHACDEDLTHWFPVRMIADVSEWIFELLEQSCFLSGLV